MDLLLGFDYIRNAVVAGFCANECISILENAGLMGLPIPGIVRNAIDLLKVQSESEV
jgi:phage-related holin